MNRGKDGHLTLNNKVGKGGAAACLFPKRCPNSVIGGNLGGRARASLEGLLLVSLLTVSHPQTAVSDCIL